MTMMKKTHQSNIHETLDGNNNNIFFETIFFLNWSLLIESGVLFVFFILFLRFYSDTPTSSGPNSFGKTKQGFCDVKKIFEKTLREYSNE